MSKQSISLVLGSGGARGLAHIGVIQALEQSHLQIKAIAGCSMGALVGGVYAAGKLGEFTTWVQELTEFDVLRFLDIALISGSGLLKGDLIINALKKLVGERNIEDLPIPFTAVATDIISGKEVWLSRGSLFDAIRASIAIPTIFTPHEIDGRVLVDGGLVNPVPIAPTFRHGCDLIVAVSLNGPVDASLAREGRPIKGAMKKNGTLHGKIEKFIDSMQSTLGMDKPTKDDRLRLSTIVLRSFDTMQKSISQFKLAAYSPDILVEIPSNVCQSYEFYRAQHIIQVGRQRAEQVLTATAHDAN